MNSSRLPGKVLMDFGGKSMLGQIIDRLGSSKFSHSIIVATTNSDLDNPIEDLCNSMKVKCYRGEEDFVLNRFIGAAHYAGANVIVRLTADNPFVDGYLVDFVLDEFLSDYPNVDYASNTDNCGFPFGLFVEVVQLDALIKCAQSATAEDQEHVTAYIRSNPKSFAIKNVFSDFEFGLKSVTVDTADDMAQLRRLFDFMRKKNQYFSFRELALVRCS